MAAKREIAEQLNADELRTVVDRFELEVEDRRARGGMCLPDRLNALCERLHINRPSPIVLDQRKRCGRCDTTGTLRINWRIVQARSALIDYVLVHGLARPQHRAHDRTFWSDFDLRLPDYDDRRHRRLRQLGPLLEW